MKATYVLLALAIIVIGVGAAFAATTYLRTGDVDSANAQDDRVSDASRDSVEDRERDEMEWEEDENEIADDDVPPVVNDSASMAQGYTMRDVAQRNTEESCWTAVRGNVYDVTNWVPDHPGGRRAILSLCGTDGTAAFEGQHGGKDGPESRLAAFKIGVLEE